MLFRPPRLEDATWCESVGGLGPRRLPKGREETEPGSMNGQVSCRKGSLRGQLDRGLCWTVPTPGSPQYSRRTPRQRLVGGRGGRYTRHGRGESFPLLRHTGNFLPLDDLLHCPFMLPHPSPNNRAMDPGGAAWVY